VKLVFATRNTGKLVELRALCAGLPLEVHGLDEPGLAAAVSEVVEDGKTFVDNARKKAEATASATGLPALADDSGLEVDALGGAPGVDSALYAGLPSGAPGADQANNQRLVDALAKVPAPRTARYRCVLALTIPGKATRFTEGTVEGEIVLAPRGAGGFGYDPYFLVPSLGKTMAELPIADKNRISHRGQAMQKMVALLKDRLQPPGVSR